MKIRDKYVKGGFGLLFFFMLAAVEVASAQPTVSPQTTPQAWFGGLNAAHFATLDMDGDGLEDYIAFDRVGSRVRCFGHDWEWRRGAEHNLPPLRAWVQTHDYNGDGQKDIFTFNGISGIAVYRNDSGKFHKITDGLEAEMFGQKTPLYCTSEDYPVIADIDGDGDLDVLNFWVPSSGDFLLYYRNFAKEELGRADTFLLRVEDWSWGCFVESEESNVIYLDSCSARNNKASAAKAGDLPHRKHAGSTLWAFKNPQTELFDLVLGDVGFPNLYYLQNGGTAQKARMVSFDTFFPRTVPVRLHDFPILSQVYVRDTLCYLYSPYQSNPFKTEGYRSLWRYADTGGGALYGKLVQKDFLQGEMMDVGVGAYPVIHDIDGDGLPDLVIGNYSGAESATLTLYRNTGTLGAPVFEKVDDDFLQLSRYGLTALYPAFADMDGDGRDEMVAGAESGALWLFRLTGAGTALAAELLSDDFLQAGLRGFSAPAFVDVNGDARPDLVVGSRNGRLTYFENVGDMGAKSGGLPRFELRSDSWGGVDVTDRDFSNFGYARPCFGRDEDGRLLLACGNENGEVYLYDSIEENVSGTFRFLGKACDTALRTLRVGLHASPSLYDFDNDGRTELIIGNQCGGLEYFGAPQWTTVRPEPVSVEPNLPVNVPCTILAKITPNPFGSQLFIETEKVCGFDLLDMRGKRVRQGKLHAGRNTLNLETLPAGLYLLHISDADSRESQKVKLIKR